MKKTKKEAIRLHGECTIKRASGIPEGATLKEPTNKQYHIVAASEQVGNHHVVDVMDNDVEIWNFGDSLFVKNAKPTKVRCLHEARHDAITLEPGIWEFGTQQEFDYFSMELRKVAD